MKKSLLLVVLTLIFAIASPAQSLDSSSPAALNQLAKLTASDGAQYGKFGIAAAISGNTVVVVSNAYPEAYAYVFVRGPNGWMDSTETATLSGSNGFVLLSGGVAVQGNTVAISGYDTSTFTYGVYVFVRPLGGWTGTVTETAVLSTLSNSYVGMSGNTIVAGGGTVYNVYVRPSVGWQSTTQPNATLNVPAYQFSTIAISGDTIVAGAAENFGGEGTVYVYVKPANGWSGTLNPTATLIASNGRLADGLGWSVAISGNTIVAGAENANQAAGAAYVFVKPTGGWTDMYETGELTAINTIDFGWSVAISGNAIVVGAPLTTFGFNQFQGTADVYLRPAGGWKSASNPTFELAATDGAPNDEFGLTVGISGKTILSASPQATIGSNLNQGAVYIFGK